MARYLTPGVYRTPQVAALPAFVLVRTDVAGFVGFAERGPLPEDIDGDFDAARVAVKIGSWKEFLVTFGGYLGTGYLAYAVRAFFENGGATCYVVRVGATTAANAGDRPAAAFFTLPAGAPTPVGTIDQIVSPFRSGFQPTGGAALGVGDLVRIDGGGVSQLNHVADVSAAGVLWTNPLESQIASGATLTRFAPACTIRAASRGDWANRIRLRITPLGGDAFALRATVDTGAISLPTEDEFYRRLTLADPAADTFAPTVLQRESTLIRMDVDVASAAMDLTVDPRLAAGQVYLQGGRDGLSAVTLRDFLGGPVDLRGLRLLEEIDEIEAEPPPQPQPVDPCEQAPNPVPDPRAADPTAIARPLAAADRHQVQIQMVDQCERLRYRVAILDPPDRLSITAMQRWPDVERLVTKSSRYAAVYYPWLKVPDPLAGGDASRRVPPSGHVAGAYANNDLTIGVHHPPANLELEFVNDVAQSISDLQQEGLNENDINAIRALPGRGIRIWGARSLAPAADAAWRFIHVRRLMSAIEETAERSSRWTVFQNNDDALRGSLKHSMSVLLEGIWAKGALKGARLADAFFVTCDATNNPQHVIDRGQVVCEVGVAVAAPMEFIVFEIRQEPSGAQVSES
jgi:Bacteriophage tail sheath protein